MSLMLFGRSPHSYYFGEDQDNVTIPGDCSLVRNHEWNATQRCFFVEHNDNCQDVDGFINYVEILYCTFSPSLFPLAVLLYILWLVLLFIALALSADDFFCPSLEIISKTLRLSQNIAGVTILAFGNGAPDIFSAMAGISAARPELVFGSLFGAGVFVTTVVAGAVCVTKPFKLMERPFLRDLSFYIMSAFWAFFVFYKGKIHLYDSLGFLGLYGIYIVVVVGGRYVHQKIRQREEDRRPFSTQVDEDEIDCEITAPPIDNSIIAQHRPTSVGEPPEVRMVPEHTAGMTIMEHLQQLAEALNPIDREEWGDQSSGWMVYFWRIYSIIKAPLVVLFRLTVPVVDKEKERHNWTQYLSIINCVLGPVFTVFSVSAGLDRIGGSEVRAWMLVLLGGFLLAILVSCTSRSSAPPVYHAAFAYAGFVISVVWIYIIANELVSLLKAFGVMFGLTDAVLGLTVLAWGNSLGDLIADTAMTKAGYPRMGYSACFAGPMFNLLLGIGIPFTIQIIRNGGEPIAVQFDPMTLTLSIGLGASLVFSFVLMFLMKFKASKVYGIVLLVSYVVFLAVALTVEFTLM